MSYYPLEVKEALVQKALSRGSQGLEQFAKENKVGYSTMQRWLKCKREGKSFGVRPKARISKQDADYLLKKHVLATANLDKQAVGMYCREQGIYSFQLEQWRDEFMSNNGDKNDQQDQTQEQNCDELKTLRAENKALKKDLRRKEKALGEATALLHLKKKADSIWGDPEDD